MASELQPDGSENGQDEQRDGGEQVEPQFVQVILTRDHTSLLLAVLHYAIENGEGMDDTAKEELRQLAVFFAAVSLEPWRFPVRTLSPTIKENKRRFKKAQKKKDNRDHLDTWESEGGA